MAAPSPDIRTFFVQDALALWNARPPQEKAGWPADKSQFLRELANRLAPGASLQVNETPLFVIKKWTADYKQALALRVVAAVFAMAAFAVAKGIVNNPALRIFGAAGNLVIAGFALYASHVPAKRANNASLAVTEFSKILNNQPVNVETFQKFLFDGVPPNALPPIAVPVLDPQAAILASSETVSEILPGLYLGNQEGAGIIPAFESPAIREQAVASLRHRGVSSIVCCIGKGNYEIPNFNYLTFKLDDNGHNANMLELFEVTFNFLETARNKGGVFVHCNAGMSRSPTIVIAYLMKKYGLSFEQALAFAKAKRPCVEPKEFFVEQLKAYGITLQKA